MDLEQTDHLRAYGVAYRSLERGENVEWLLNYRGGAFLLEDSRANERECLLAGVAFARQGGGEISQIYDTIEANNMEVVLLEKAPRICVYTPPNKQPWDDAVTMALTYADIPFEKVWDEEVLAGKLLQFDWVHLHHEDFTGQYGKFWASYASAPWYVEQQRQFEAAAHAAGFATVWEHKQAVVRRIREYVAQGGFLFAMCSATDTFDISLAAQGVDIVDVPYDGDGPDPGAQSRLQFDNCFVFHDFHLEMHPSVYEFSDIDMTEAAIRRGQRADFFTLFDFSAKEDPVPTMLTQCHVNVIPGFMGQTTSFRKSLLKKSTIVLAETEGAGEVKYLHGNFGQGTFTFYGGHDPEDYQHRVGDPPTDLRLHKNSPGYRLILNNILFPAAEKKERKT
ncbi:MAG: asparagine synthetase B [Candidatus Eisenbacteria bacterium]